MLHACCFGVTSRCFPLKSVLAAGHEIFKSGAAILEMSFVEKPWKIWQFFKSGITHFPIHSLRIASASAFFWEPYSKGFTLPVAMPSRSTKTIDSCPRPRFVIPTLPFWKVVIPPKMLRNWTDWTLDSTAKAGFVLHYAVCQPSHAFGIDLPEPCNQLDACGQPQ